MPKRSAGILLYRGRGVQLEVLIAHMGGPFWIRKEKGAWTVPKGLIDPGEEPLAAARREFEEELGSPPPVEADPIDLGTISQSNDKVVQAWAIKGDFDPATVRSNTVRTEWPPRSGRYQEFPEVDRAEWFSPERIGDRLVKGQGALVERLTVALAQP